MSINAMSIAAGDALGVLRAGWQARRMVARMPRPLDVLFFHTQVTAVLAADWGYSREDVERIKLGLIPEVMEDKWFIYWEGDSLYFHRKSRGYEADQNFHKSWFGQWSWVIVPVMVPFKP